MPAPRPEHQKLIQMLEAFVAGENTSREFVKQIDAEFWACELNEDDRFSGLLMALDMFGVPLEDHGYDEKMLAFECREALWLLKNR